MCPQPQPASTILPDRVIDCSDTQKPKIVLTGGNKHGLYVALSYVWGGTQPMATTENIDEYVTKGLDMARFPKTIQDAVLATHSFGQRYLWIDALCILQDSREDKAVQLGMMGRIYSDAYFVINSACASNVHEGFLEHPRPKKVPDAHIPYRCPDGSVGSVYIAREMEVVPGDVSRSYCDIVEPVTHRAWCMQERLLPPRNMIYASDTLKFSCNTETVNIGGALCELNTLRRLPGALCLSRGTSEDALQADGEEEVARRQAWLGVLFVYSIRSLSVSSDKLPALSGVAEYFQRLTGDQYLAGLWRRTLLLDLLWERESFADPRPRPAGYRAPSWSWASTDAMISLPDLERRFAKEGHTHLGKAEILDCKVQLASEHVPFGEVTGGFLRIKGVMKHATMERSAKMERTVHVPGRDGELVKIGIVSLDAEEDRPERVYVIPLVWDVRGSFSMGIAVVEASQGQYKRVGRFKGNSTRESTAVTDWMAKLVEQEVILI